MALYRRSQRGRYRGSGHKRRSCKVRIAGIDAPELDQPFGELARTLLATLVLGRHVTVESSERDKYRSDGAGFRPRLEAAASRRLATAV
jgi:hypothetical protein